MWRYWLTLGLAAATGIVMRADGHDIAPLAVRWFRWDRAVAGPTAGLGIALLCLLASDGMRPGRSRVILGAAGVFVAWAAWVAVAAPSDVLLYTALSSAPFLALSVTKLYRLLGANTPLPTLPPAPSEFPRQPA